ncbi:hypothetical protein GNX71_30030 [Variovorax sp. RKNM96]|uniref:hypothetical protein n=1 Tax=Variovorax sp. RKNM96 TaxID=2681552 RepID=UPI001981A3A7|nr:hypothetical protein [Variovorax sp. RKNM96]QSI33577.1 hypothetical protein GNX71_30030 [Variovorax sp. RKNM96]
MPHPVRASTRLCAIACLCALAAPGKAQLSVLSPTKAATTTERNMRGLARPASPDELPAPSSPIALTLGKTTRQEAELAWIAQGSKIVRSGALGVGGSGLADYHVRKGVPEIVLTDVAGVDFEGFTVARYAFIEDVLYAIETPLYARTPRSETPFKALDATQLQALARKLEAIYGAPTRTGFTPRAGKEADVLTWETPQGTLTLVTNDFFAHLSLRDAELQKKAKAFARAACDQATAC